MSRSNSNPFNNNKWAPNEEQSCIGAVDKLVVSTKHNHDVESNSKELGIDHALEQQRAREMSELRLLAEAVHGQDVIGLTALTTGFWSHKNAMVRQKRSLEKLLPKREEAEELIETLRQLQLQAEDPKDATAIARLIDTVQRANFVELARYATEVQRRLCEYSPMVSAYQALGGHAMVTTAPNEQSLSPSRYNAGATASALSRQPHLTLNEDGQENRLAECVRVADSSLQDAEMRANQLREQLAGLFAGFEQLKLPRAMHAFIPRSIASGDAPAPRAAAVHHHHVAAAPRQNSQSVPRGFSQHQSNFNSQHPLLNGYTTMHLLRVLCVEASTNDTPEGLAAQFGVETHCITDVHQQPLEPLEPFREPTKVLVHIGNPMKGLEESLVSLHRRIELIEKTTLPRAKERLVAAREALWSAELENLQAPLKGDGGVTERRRAAEQLERDQKRAEEVLEQCKTHRDALLVADFGRISFLLESKQLEALEGLGASERLVYTCKEIDKNVSVQDFADRLGIPAGELITFVDEKSGITMAYVPTLVPRRSLLELDEELRKQFNDFKTAHPDHPPRTDILEHLYALRAGDVATLSNILSQVRNELETTENGIHRVQLQELQERVKKLQEANEQSSRIIHARDETILLLRSQNDDFRFAVTAAKERADAADGALQQSRNEFVTLDEEVRELRNRNAAVTDNLRASEHRSEGLQKEITTLRQQYEDLLRTEMQNAQDEKNTLSANRESMQAQIDQLLSNKNQLEAEIQSTARRIDLLTQQRDEARQNSENLRTQLAESNVQVKNSAVAQSERNIIQSQLDSSNAELAETKRKAQEQIELLQRQARTADEKANLYEQRYKKLEEDTTKAMQSRDLQLGGVSDAYKKQHSAADAAREAAEQEATVLRRQLQNVIAELATARAVRNPNPSSPTTTSNNSNNNDQRSLLHAGVNSPGRGLLDPPMAGGSGATPRRRVVYVCRPMPRGTTANQIAAEFGVSLADVLGPFTETHSGDQFLYVPTIADGSNLDIVRQDERLRSAIVNSAQSGDGSGLPSVTLLEALHALRSGDIATLAQKVLDGEERVAKAEALLALQARSDALAGVEGTRQAMPYLDVADTQALIDDDVSHDSTEVLREKIHLLKEALASMRNRVAEWKALAEDYKQQLIAEQADDITAEHVKADYEQRLESKLKQIQGLVHEVQQLKKDMAAAEQRKEEELQVMQTARQRLVADKDQTIMNLKRQLDDLRQQHERTLRLLNEHDH